MIQIIQFILFCLVRGLLDGPKEGHRDGWAMIILRGVSDGLNTGFVDGCDEGWAIGRFEGNEEGFFWGETEGGVDGRTEGSWEGKLVGVTDDKIQVWIWTRRRFCCLLRWHTLFLVF